MLFQLIANYVKNIDNQILKYEIIAKLYFLEINGLNLNQGLQFRSLDKKLQFSFQEKQFLLQKINQETQLLTNLKENFYQATNQLMLSLHQLLNKNNKNFQSQINWNLS